MVKDIEIILFEKRDLKYKEFQAKLIPNIDPDTVIGVRTPDLKELAKNIYRSGGYEDFLNDLPHRYFDENQLHSFILCNIKDYDITISYVNSFLRYVDNWATCDQLSPRSFSKNKDKLICDIKKWISSEHNYTIRFAIEMLMSHFLGDDFKLEYSEMVAQIDSDDYYIKMMQAWYFATALVKNHDIILPYLTENRLGTWVHNKTIQKAVESYRIDQQEKEYLKSIKRK